MTNVDLSPREVPQPVPARRRWMPVVVLALVLVVAGVLVTQFLRSAVDYYCNADEIGRRSGCEIDRRLRIQGTVDEGSIERVDGVTSFSISFNDATVPVRYQGEPGGMFAECQPVVVHGEMAGATFMGDDVEVKHSNEYVAENVERVDAESAAAESSACSDQR